MNCFNLLIYYSYYVITSWHVRQSYVFTLARNKFLGSGKNYLVPSLRFFVKHSDTIWWFIVIVRESTPVTGTTCTTFFQALGVPFNCRSMTTDYSKLWIKGLYFADNVECSVCLATCTPFIIHNSFYQNISQQSCH